MSVKYSKLAKQMGALLHDVFDQDFVDVLRDTGAGLVEVYRNLPCHFAFIAPDSPEPLALTTAPIDLSVEVHAPLSHDFRNNDYFVLKRVNEDGALAALYQGRAGMPQKLHSRQVVSVAMQSAVTPECECDYGLTSDPANHSAAQEGAAFRILANSLYAIDGAQRLGWHWARPIALSMESTNAFRTATDGFRHGFTNDEIRIEEGAALRLEPHIRFVRIESTEKLPSGEFLFVFADATLPDEHENAQLTDF